MRAATQTADSDIDLLVVFPHAVDKAAEAVRIRRAIGRINTGADIVVSSAQEVAEWENVPGTVFYYARREGRPIHGRTSLDLARDPGLAAPRPEHATALQGHPRMLASDWNTTCHASHARPRRPTLPSRSAVPPPSSAGEYRHHPVYWNADPRLVAQKFEQD